MMPGIESIQPCIDTLYHVFETYRFTAMEGDMGTCDPTPLLEAPLRELPPQAFERFAWKAMTTWGSVADFKHFLPRMLELLVTEVEPAGFSATMRFERWLLFSKIAYGKWHEWPANEIDAIKAFILTWGRQLISLEYGLGNSEKENPMRPLWLPDQWESEWDAARAFLADLDNLEDQELKEQLKSFWSEQLTVDTGLGPFINLAKVYVSESDIDPSDLDDWFKQPERVQALYAAWVKHQDHELLGSFFSGAHAQAELICSQYHANAGLKK